LDRRKQQAEEQENGILAEAGDRMSEKKKISVILPVYNVERYLEKCMTDILGQTLKEIEVICIDDGSEDGSLEILREYERRDARVRVVSQKNAGAAAARNRGMALAQGKYLSFLDSDDFFEPDMLEKAYQCAQRERAEITIFRGNRYDDTLETYLPMDYSIKSRQLPEKNPFSWRDMPDHIFTFAVGWAWDKLYLRTFVEDAKLQFQQLRTSNDLYFVFSSLVKAERIFTMEDLLVHHRIHVKGSLSVTREKSWRCFFEACTALQEELIRMGVYENVEKGFVSWALHFCFWNLDTIEGAAYEKVYDLICEECCGRFGFFRHPREDYAQPELYDRLLQMRGRSSVESLLLEKKRLEKEREQMQMRIRRLEEENRAVKSSPTFRAGRIVTAVPGKIRRMIRKDRE